MMTILPRLFKAMAPASLDEDLCDRDDRYCGSADDHADLHEGEVVDRELLGARETLTASRTRVACTLSCAWSALSATAAAASDEVAACS